MIHRSVVGKVTVISIVWIIGRHMVMQWQKVGVC